MSDAGNLAAALAGCDEQQVKTLVREKLDAGVPAGEVLAECNQGMVQLGNRFAEGDCYIPELMFGGMIMKSVSAELGTALESGGPVEPVGKAVIGTVLHDVHDIGKDILVMMLRGIGFEVVDLGVDVPAEKFVEAIREHQPEVAGLSVLLTTCYQSVTDTVAAIREAGGQDANLKIYPDEGHGAGRTVFSTPEFYDWMFSKKAGQTYKDYGEPPP